MDRFRVADHSGATPKHGEDEISWHVRCWANVMSLPVRR